LFHIHTGLANAAFEGNLLAGGFERIGWRKVHRPEIRIGVDEGDAVDVAARFTANLPDEADRSFFGSPGEPQRQEFIRRKSISRDNSSAVAAKDDGIRFFRKHFSGCVSPEQDDGYFFCDAAASAFLWHRSTGSPLLMERAPVGLLAALPYGLVAL